MWYFGTIQFRLQFVIHCTARRPEAAGASSIWRSHARLNPQREGRSGGTPEPETEHSPVGAEPGDPAGVHPAQADADQADRLVEPVGDGSYLMDSRLSVQEVNDVLEISLNTRVSYTIGGLVMTQLGHIPQEGEYMLEQGYRFSVLDSTDKSIVRLKVERG